MIDREARDHLALALRRLAAGRITNDAFEDQAFDPLRGRVDDPALSELATLGWLHYDDLRTYCLRGRHSLSREERREIARAVLFLKTNQEYVHGDSIISRTMLSDGYRRLLLCVIILAVIAGVVSYFGLGSFWLGLGSVLLPAYLISYVRTGVLLLRRRAVRRALARNQFPAIAGSFWRYMDERASMPSFQFWPFATREAYDEALATPPFLAGVSK